MKYLLLSLALLSPCAYSQDWAKQKLEKSTRHREWVKVQHDGRTVEAYVAYPEVSTKAPVVVINLAVESYRTGKTLFWDAQHWKASDKPVKA